MELGAKELRFPGELRVQPCIVGLILGLRYVEFPGTVGPVLWGEDVEGGAL